jgi:hypothetical protein
MEGTQMPINIAAFTSPLKNNISEKISERNAAINNNLSVAVNFLNMILLIFKFLNDLNEQCKYEYKTNLRYYYISSLFPN